MPAPQLHIVDHAPAHDAALITDGVLAFGRSQALAGHAQPIACLAREAGQLIAGALGRTEYHRLFIGHLWVTEPLRGQGLGTQVLTHLEHAARHRGCTDALIETLDDRTAALYQRLGYRTLAAIPGYVGPFTRHVMVKDLSAACRTAAFDGGRC